MVVRLLGLVLETKAQIERRYGVPFDRPVSRMRELVAACGHLHRGHERHPARLPRSTSPHAHADAARCPTRDEPARRAAHRPRRCGLRTDGDDRRGRSTAFSIMPFDTAGRSTRLDPTEPRSAASLAPARTRGRPHLRARGDPVHRSRRGRAARSPSRCAWAGRGLRWGHARRPSGPRGARPGRASRLSRMRRRAGEAARDGVARGTTRGAGALGVWGRRTRSRGDGPTATAVFAGPAAVYFPDRPPTTDRLTSPAAAGRRDDQRGAPMRA